MLGRKKSRMGVDTGFVVFIVRGVRIDREVLSDSVLLLFAENENGTSFFRSQSKVLSPVSFHRMIVSLVIVNLHRLLARIGPSQLNGTTLRTTRMIPQYLCVSSNLAVSKGNHRFVGRELVIVTVAKGVMRNVRVCFVVRICIRICVVFIFG